MASVHFCDKTIQLSNKGYGNIDHSIALVDVKFNQATHCAQINCLSVLYLL